MDEMRTRFHCSCLRDGCEIHDESCNAEWVAANPSHPDHKKHSPNERVEGPLCTPAFLRGLSRSQPINPDAADGLCCAAREIERLAAEHEQAFRCLRSTQRMLDEYLDEEMKL